jgi:tetratricopeptide (TPR) repeat protein
MSKPRRGEEESFSAWEGAGDSENRTPVETPVKASARAASAASGTAFDDPVVRRLAWLAGLLVVAFLATIVSALFFGVLNPPAPRTALERELSVARARVESTDTTATGQDWYDYSVALIAAKQYSKAERIIKQGTDGGFEDPTKQYFALAQTRLDIAQKDYEAALTHSKEGMTGLEKRYQEEQERFKATQQASDFYALGLTGNYDEFRLLRAEAFESLKRYDEAIAELDGYLTNQARAADILVWRGDLKVKAGDKQGAVADYENASMYMPGDTALAKKLEDLGASND